MIAIDQIRAIDKSRVLKKFDRLSKSEIHKCKNIIRETFVDITYVGESKEENLDVSFTLEQEDLGEFLHVIFGCGHELNYS